MSIRYWLARQQPVLSLTVGRCRVGVSRIASVGNRRFSTFRALRSDAVGGGAGASAQRFQSSIDHDEVAKFSRLSREWWDVDGRFAPLHDLNPTRLQYVRERIVQHFYPNSAIAAAATTTTSTAATDATPGGRLRRPLNASAGASASIARPLRGLRILDVGCGGGLVAESLARLGGTVLGIDASAQNISIARAHAALDPQLHTLQYRHTTAEELLVSGGSCQFDAVVSLEVVEHVASPAPFIATLSHLLQSDGALVLGTLNRTLTSRALAIVMAEYVLGWVPPGTHEWNKFLTPDELTKLVHTAHTIQPTANANANANATTVAAASSDSARPTDSQAWPLAVNDVTGLVYNPIALRPKWRFSATDMRVNYMLTAAKQPPAA